MKKVSIIILDYKNKKDTKACIESLSSLMVTDIELSIILVNNDIATEYKKEDFPTPYALHIINSVENDGFSGGNNRGIKKALHNQAEYLMLLNNDTIVDN